MERSAYLAKLQRSKKSTALNTLFERYDTVKSCPVRTTSNLIGGKWKPVIYYIVMHDVNRFGEMLHMIGDISKKMLTSQLRELENDGILNRVILSQKPLHIEYYISEKGKSLAPVINAMCDWGMTNPGR